MLIPYDQLRDLYIEIRNNNLEGSSICILVAGDIDALAACKVFLELLTSDHIEYRVFPVCDYTDLDLVIQNIKNINSLVLINCGGNANLFEYCSNGDFICYLFDSQRPFEQENINSMYVKIIDDFTIEQAEDSEGDEEDPVVLGERRKRESLEPVKRIKKNPQSTGIHFGLSTAGVFFEMAVQLNKGTNLALWMWLTGVTEQYLHKKITKAEYDHQITGKCLPEVVRLNSAPNEDSVAETLENEGIELKTENKQPGNIEIDYEDMKLILYRHWSLYESMLFSDQIVYQLQIWKESGKNKLNELLAVLGIPLSECRESYRYMEPSLKSDLKKHLLGASSMISIDELFFTTCIRQYDRKNEYSAADIVHIITAILESPSSSKPEETGHPGKTIWQKNFWKAYDALNEVSLLKEGVKLAKEMQKAIIVQGTSLIEKKAVNPAADFRYAIIESDTIDEVKFFHNPFTLKKLAIFLLEAYKIYRRNKPMVVGVHNSAKDVFLVAGVTHHTEIRNDFGWRFQVAADSANAEYRRDFFEDSYIEVKKDYFEDFLEHLTAGQF